MHSNSILPTVYILEPRVGLKYALYSELEQPTEAYDAPLLQGGIDYETLLRLVKERAEKDSLFRSRLMASGETYILYEKHHQSKWGADDDGMGENLAGKALMQARAEILQKDVFSLEAFNENFELMREKARKERKNLDEKVAAAEGLDLMFGSKTYGLSLPELINKSRELEDKKKLGMHEATSAEDTPPSKPKVPEPEATEASPVSTLKLEKDGLTYVTFYDSDRPNYIFANYWKSPVNTYDLGSFPTPEHYFQAQKFLDQPSVVESIKNLKTADEARRAGNDNKMSERALNAWMGGYDYQAMVNVIWARVGSDPEFKKILLATNDSYILEDTYKGPDGKPDAKWGGGADGMGQNLLGKALMHVRTGIQQGEAFDLKAFEKNFEEQQTRAREERQRLDKRLGVKNTQGKRLEDLQRLDQGSKATKKISIDTTSVIEVADKTSVAARSTGITSNPNLHATENLKKIGDYLTEKFGEDNWQATKRYSEEGALIAYDVSVFAELKSKKAPEPEPTHQFSIYPHKLATDSNDADTYIEMLQALKAVHGKSFKPYIKVDENDAKMIAAWKDALIDQGFKDNPEQYIHVDKKLAEKLDQLDTGASKGKRF